MHSESDNLGYLKDQERQIFRGLRHLDPPPGLCPGPAGGAPGFLSPKNTVNATIASTYKRLRIH